MGPVLPLVKVALGFALPYAKRHAPTFALVGVLVLQGVVNRATVNGLKEELKTSRNQTEAVKEALATANNAIVRLNEQVKNLPVGETKTFFVEVPKYIGYPNPIPVFITRTEKTIETKIETVVLPPEKIKEIIEKSVQSIVATMTALRDIKQGEKFTVTFAQVGPGIWLPIVTADSPVGVDAKVVTPVDKIPQPVEAQKPPGRFSFLAYSGFSTQDRWVAGVRPAYQFSPTFGIEGQSECRGLQVQPSVNCTRGIDHRIVGTVRF